MEHIRESIQETIKRMRQRAEDPEYQARIEAMEAAEHDRLAAQAEAAHVRYLVESGIPRAYWDHLNVPRETDALAAVREILDGKGPIVVMLGGPKGRGKTTALAFACHQKRGRFVEAQDLFRLSSFVAEEWRELQETPLLALDEAGAEFLGDALALNLFAVLNARIQNLRPTAIATNLSLADFRARFLRGPLERLDDRLRAAGKWVSLPGESMRTHWSESTKESTP